MLNRLVSGSLKRLPLDNGAFSQRAGSLGTREEFDLSRALINTVHGKLSQSAVIQDWHEGFHRALESAVIYALKAKGVSNERARMLATVATFLVEGS